MAILYKNIEDLCKARGVSITQMCRDSGASRGSLTDLKMGRITALHPDTLLRIASYFGVSMDELYNEKSPAAESDRVVKHPIDERREFADSLFAALSPEDQELALVFLKKLSQSQQVQDGRKESD